jgi:hypothetical protein
MDYIKQKRCRSCKEIKNIEEYPFFSTNEAGRKNTCKECSKRLSALRKRLREANPPPIAGECPICHIHTPYWILDHCHFSNEFRGYICNSCNLGLGKFYDDVNILRSAIDYLTKQDLDYQI